MRHGNTYHRKQTSPSPLGYRGARCATCGYLTVLPCGVCTERPPVTYIDTDALIAATVAANPPQHPAYEPIVQAVMQWCAEHPRTNLTVKGFHDAFDGDASLPYSLSLVYEIFHSLVRL